MNAMTDCAGKCDQGDGSTAASDAFRKCQDACISSYIITSGTAAPGGQYTTAGIAALSAIASASGSAGMSHVSLVYVCSLVPGDDGHENWFEQGMAWSMLEEGVPQLAAMATAGASAVFQTTVPLSAVQNQKLSTASASTSATATSSPLMPTFSLHPSPNYNCLLSYLLLLLLIFTTTMLTTPPTSFSIRQSHGFSLFSRRISLISSSKGKRQRRSLDNSFWRFVEFGVWGIGRVALGIIQRGVRR